MEVLQTPVFINHLPTGIFYEVNNNLIAEYTATVQDPDSPNTPLYYRVDWDNWTGPVQLATSNTFQIPNIPANFDVTAGTHHIKLFVFDNETRQIVQITKDFFGNTNTGGLGVNVTDPTTAPDKLVTGSVDVLATVNGVSFFNDAQFLGISGTASDSKDTKATITIELFIDGDYSNPIAITNEPNVQNKWIFSPELLIGSILPGLHYAQVAAVDPDDGNVVLLGEGELSLPSTDPTDPAFHNSAAAITDANVQTITGFVQANVNDPVPATFSQTGGVVEAQPTFIVDVNKTQFATLHNTPGTPGEIDAFTVNTPQLNTSAGNTVHVSYWDPFVGGLTVIATRAMDQTRVFNFVNQRLNVSGNVPPTGNIDAASTNQIAGWVRDPDNGPESILYRLDYDNIVGTPTAANLLRTDLPFGTGDQNHGFSVLPPMLTAGAHTVKLYAIDPTTLEVFLISQRSFTVQDDANKRPLGAIEVLTSSRIAGWTQDPTTPANAVTIELDVDGVLAGTFSATSPRTDIVRNGQFAKGFDFAVPGSVAAGRSFVHRLRHRHHRPDAQGIAGRFVGGSGNAQHQRQF